MRQGIFLRQSTSVQTLLRCSYSPRVPAHASISVCTLKIQTLTVTPLCGHRTILHTLVGMGSAALTAAVCLPMYNDPYFPQKANEVAKK